MIQTGIYAIESPSGKRYIGSTVSFKARWRAHLKKLRAGNHHSYLLQRAWNRYGEELKFIVLLVCEKSDLLFYEQCLIEGFRPAYNVAQTAGRPHLGTVLNQTHREKISAALTGRVFSAEHKEKLSKAATGRKLSDEMRAAMSVRYRGRKHSEESKRKISIGNRGRRWSIEARQKLSDIKRGKKNPKVSESKTGMKYNVVKKQRSETTRANMRAAWVLRRQNRK